MLKLAVLAAVLGVVFFYYTNLHKIVPGPIVSTTNGPVQGITSKSRDGKTFYEYFGIPYAKPPIGELRYEPPQHLDSKWTEVRDASQLGNECLQLNLMLKRNQGSEDCLYLNVYTPGPVKPGEKLKKTLVWIHGGLFVFGSSSMYRGDYLVDEDVVLVTLNYRLAALGFLNTGDGLVRGNMGLKDQNLALKWVKSNIANFGGDPDDITLLGESAGGASVDYHLRSPLSKGLFTKAVAQSGVAASAWAVKLNPAAQAKRYAENVGCPTETTTEMVACLKRASPEDLLRGHHEVTAVIKDAETLFGPTVETVLDENTFVAENPLEWIRKGKNVSVPVLYGYNSDEGLLISPTIVRDTNIMAKFESDFNTVMAEFLMFPSSDRNVVNAAMQKARNYYFGEGESVNSFGKFQNFTNLVTDFYWAESFYKNAKVLQNGESPVYLYYYSYKGKFTLTNVLLALKGKFPIAVEFFLYKFERFFREWVLGETYTHYGACHGDELALLFKLAGLYDVGRNHEDYTMSKKVVKLWVAFAKHGRPGKFEGVEWYPIQSQKNDLKYMLIDEKNPAMISQPNRDRIDFWSDIIN